MSGKHIGFVRLIEPHTFTNTYETAAWWAEVACDPQTVPAHLSTFSTPSVAFAFDGTYTAVNTPSLYGGVAVGREPQGKDHRDVGKPARHVLYPYAYGVAAMLADVEATVLDDGMEWLVPAPVREGGPRFAYRFLPGVELSMVRMFGTYDCSHGEPGGHGRISINEYAYENGRREFPALYYADCRRLAGPQPREGYQRPAFRSDLHDLEKDAVAPATA